MAVLATATAPLSAGDIMLRFKPGKTVRPKVDAVLDGLVRMGIVSVAARQFRSGGGRKTGQPPVYQKP